MKIDTIVKRHGLIKAQKEVLDDQTAAPGPKMLIAGDMDAGFFGEVSNEEISTMSELFLLIGVAGSMRNNETIWLKFALDQKICFFPLSGHTSINMRYIKEYSEKSLSGIELKGHYYNLRPLKILGPDYSIDNYHYGNLPPEIAHHNSEIEKIILPLFNKSEFHSDMGLYFSSNFSEWGIYNVADFQISRWFQFIFLDSYKRSFKGRYLDVVSNRISVRNVEGPVGGGTGTWRPFLEYVEEV